MTLSSFLVKKYDEAGFANIGRIDVTHSYYEVGASIMPKGKDRRFFSSCDDNIYLAALSGCQVISSRACNGLLRITVTGPVQLKAKSEKVIPFRR